MERCDFSSVFKVIKNNIGAAQIRTNAFLMEELFSLYLIRDNKVSFDNRAMSRYINGQDALNNKVVVFYLYSDENRAELKNTIENEIVPLFYDPAMAAQDIYDLVTCDMSVSADKKQEICKSYPCKSHSDIADLFCNALAFGMERPFVSREASLITSSGNSSPAVVGYILDGNVPKPCKHFCGRENEVAELHELLKKNSKVFINGKPGIGKSEFIKKYAEEHKADYTQILYFNYYDNLENTIINIRFADDGIYLRETPSERYERHSSFLKALKEDTLIIIDNFNTTASEEELLDEIINYRCRIIFTTRSRFDEYITCEHIEIQDFDTLFSLVKYFYSNAETEKEIVTEIIEVVYRHTMSVELAARVLEDGIHDPAVVLDKLIEGYGILDSSDKINVKKDGKSKKATHDWHIRTLFSLYDLSEPEQNIMRNMALIPLDGIDKRLFAEWLELSDLNDINRLDELGFVQVSEGKIRLQPLIRDITISLLEPSVNNCNVFIDSVLKYCKRSDIADFKLPFQIADNIIKIITNDNVDRHFSFVCAVYPLMHKQMYGHGMKLIIDRLDENYDPATLYHFRAMYEEAINSNPDKAFELEKQAFEHCDENNTFAFKINSNLGYYYHHFGNRELAELHYRNAFSLCNRRIETLEDFNDVILATRQYINLIIDSDRIIEALDILEKWITRIYEQFGEINSPYADMVFFKGVVSFKSENEKSGWHCFREAVRIYSVIYENNADEQREKIEMIIKVIKSFNLTPSPDYDDFTEQITGKTAVLL